MIEGGLVIFILGFFMACSTTVERAIIHRRFTRSEMMAPPLSAAFPVVAPSPSLDDLMQDAAAALDADDLMRGVRAISDIYDLPQR